MKKCLRCSAELTDSVTECTACGLSNEDINEETAVLPADPHANTPTKLSNPSDRNRTHATTGGGTRFISGTLPAGRYRIVGLIGKGGMGEVYKTDDLELDQTVALKFLPEKLSTNEELLRRFRGEVRNARQVSQRNVCRVFDIGETEGLYYLTMEHIDGDDLSMLLKRIGRLPSAKAVEISRDICMGLAAIHKAGILHRDLKPANIIIDSKGEARITDFGIAGIEAEVQGNESRVGTPAYMSPEQIDGKEVTQRSDIYSLGLLLYEIFTGKQAFEGDSVQELQIKQATTSPKNPSEIVSGLDPLVERVITQCLEKNPKDRPQSALQVAMALPGGNPMQIALDAGQTPSPEMVAATPVKGALKPWIALALLLCFVAAFSAALYFKATHSINYYAPLDKPPAVLAERARSVIKNLGYTDTPKDTDYKFVDDGRSYRNFVMKQDDQRGWIEKLRNGQPEIYYFRYRASPEYLRTIDYSRITKDSPPLTVPGMVTVNLDVTGRLTTFTAVPPADFSSGDRSAKTDWKKLFDEAGLDIASFRPVDLRSTPPVAFDETAAWEGMMAGTTDVPVRVEAAGFRARPVYFQVVPSWKEPDTAAQTAATQDSSSSLPDLLFNVFMFLVTFIGPIVLVRYNIKKGSGDLKGAIKIGLVFLVLSLCTDFLVIDVPPTFRAINDFLVRRVGDGLFVGTQAGLFYLAIEPFVRRRWPEILVSWSRLVMGNLRDPLVGRDILVGITFGVVFYLARFGLHYIEFWFDPKEFVSLILYSQTDHIMGTAGALEDVLDKLKDGMRFSFLLLFTVLVITLIFRKKFLGVIVTFLIFVGPDILSGGDFWAATAGSVLWFALAIFLLVRFGVVTMASFVMLGYFFVDTAFTLDPSSFYFPSTVLMSATAFILAGYAYYISLAGKKVFGEGDFFGE